MKGLKGILISISILFYPLISIAENEWILKKEYKDGIKVFTRNTSESSFDEFKVIAKFKTSMNSIVSLLEDTNSCQEWVYRCIKEELLKRISPSESYKYSVSDGSPFSDRDSIVHIIRIQDPKTKIVTFKRTGKPNYIKEKLDIVRVLKVRGSWILTPRNNGVIEVIFQTLSEPGGIIPSLFANIAVTETAHETLLGMKRMLKKPKYRDAKGLVEEYKESR